MKIKFAIPSYGRASTILTHTIGLLQNYKIPKKNIYIFVIQEELEDYKKVLPEYKNIIVGVKGLYQQRNFITKYFNEGDYIVNLDDDIKTISILEDDTLNIIENFYFIIKKAFEICHEKQAYLWGIHQTTHNAYFLRNSITFDFSFIVGHLWGCINRHSEDLEITMDIKEDYERTIKYWLKDNCLVKFNYISAQTNTYTNAGGLQIDYPDRTDASITACDKLIELYDEYFRYRFTKLNDAGNSKYWEIRCIKGINSLRNYYKQLDYINEDCKIIKSILDTLKIKPLQKNYKRLSSGIGMSQCFGKYRIRKQTGLFESKNNAKYPILYDLLKEFYNKYVISHIPEYTSIQVNVNYQTKPHYDRNAGESYIIGLGDYKGGDLIVNSYKHNIKYHPIMFEGNKWLHGTSNFEGERITLVYFKQNTKNNNLENEIK